MIRLRLKRPLLSNYHDDIKFKDGFWRAEYILETEIDYILQQYTSVI